MRITDPTMDHDNSWSYTTEVKYNKHTCGPTLRVSKEEGIKNQQKIKMFIWKKKREKEKGT